MAISCSGASPMPWCKSIAPRRPKSSQALPVSASMASRRPSSVPMKTRVLQAGFAAPRNSPLAPLSAGKLRSCHSATPRHLAVHGLLECDWLSNSQRCCPVSASTANARLKPEQK